MKARLIGITGLLLLAVSAVLVFGLTPDEEKKGLVTYADGQVKKSATAEAMWENAPVNTEILSGDRIRTYRESRAELNLAQLDTLFEEWNTLNRDLDQSRRGRIVGGSAPGRSHHRFRHFGTGRGGCDYRHGLADESGGRHHNPTQSV